MRGGNQSIEEPKNTPDNTNTPEWWWGWKFSNFFSLSTKRVQESRNQSWEERAEWPTTRNERDFKTLKAMKIID